MDEAGEGTRGAAPAGADLAGRRPLATRGTRWAQWLAARLARIEALTPNRISLAGIGFAAVGMVLMLAWPTPLAWIAAAACVQLRLLCNLLDGMVAVEGGRQTPTGVLYNELPDRISDALLLVAFGYAAGQGWLGWLLALLAVLAACIRATGTSLGCGHDFRGPQAKPQRMAALTAALLLGAAELHWRGSHHVLLAAAVLMAIGIAWTCWRRTRAIAAALEARG